MNTDCIVTFHLSTGDNFTCYALVLKTLEKYSNVHIFCLHRNKNFVKQLYEKHNGVIIHILDENYNNCGVPRNEITNLKLLLKNADVIETGHNYNGWNNIQLSGNLFWRKFYIQASMNYDIRYDYMTINRNLEKETSLYNDMIKNYGNEYIFVHDHRNMFYKHNCIRKNVIVDSILPIFHPNTNYYDKNDSKYALWDETFYRDNLLDYCTLLENATEIHLSDSSFSCMCVYLDLSKVKKKCIYTSLNYIDYHNSFNDWEIIAV